MNRKLNLSLAFAAGLLGGMLSRYLTPMPVLAQVQASAPKEIRAQSFVVVNQSGLPLGEFSIDPDGLANIRLYDDKGQAGGKVIWRARGMSIQPAVGNIEFK